MVKERFFSKMRNKSRWYILVISIQHYTRDSKQCTKVEKEIKGNCLCRKSYKIYKESYQN